MASNRPRDRNRHERFADPRRRNPPCAQGGLPGWRECVRSLDEGLIAGQRLQLSLLFLLLQTLSACFTTVAAYLLRPLS